MEMEKGEKLVHLIVEGQHDVATVRYTQPERLSTYNTRLHHLLKKLPLCAVKHTMCYIQPRPIDERRFPSFSSLTWH